MTLYRINGIRLKQWGILLVVLFCFSGCQKQQPEPITIAAHHERCAPLQRKIYRLQIELLEKSARNRALETQLSAQQKLTDEAVLEVVRTKAKLRSIESRAEAASTLAEAEIALKNLKERVSSETKAQSKIFAKAELLLEMSALELKRENYGGALYLSGQAMGRIKAIQVDLNRQPENPSAPDEKLFPQPLPLKVLKRSNLRSSPDLSSNIVKVLGKETLIIGYAHKHNWIRVQTEDGGSGWIYQTLVGVR